MAVQALVAASGYVDVELDLVTGTRSHRGEAARAALLAACPGAEDGLIVNNGAAALVLATTALASGREVVVSRGELIEIGAGFRLPDLIASTGARLREVGTTNRTHLRDYADALGPDTGCVLKVHPSNYRVEGFTAAVSLPELRSAVGDVPLLVDLGSGLLAPDPLLPDEPDATTISRRAPTSSPPAATSYSADRRPAGARPRGNRPAAGPPPAGPRGPRRQTHPRRDRGDVAAGGLTGGTACTPTRTGCGRGPTARRRGRRAGGRARRPGRRRRCAGRPPAGLGGPAARVGGGPAAHRPARGAAAGARRRAAWSTCAASPRPTTTGCSTPSARLRLAGADDARRGHRRPRRPRQEHPGPRAHRHGTGPLGGGTPPRADHRPRVRLDDAAVRSRRRVRRRPRARAVPGQHAGRPRPGAHRLLRRRRRRGLAGAVERPPRRRRRAGHRTRADRRSPGPTGPPTAAPRRRARPARAREDRSAGRPRGRGVRGGRHRPGRPAHCAGRRAGPGARAGRHRAAAVVGRPVLHHHRRRHGGHRHARGGHHRPRRPARRADGRWSCGVSRATGRPATQ